MDLDVEVGMELLWCSECEETEPARRRLDGSTNVWDLLTTHKRVHPKHRAARAIETLGYIREEAMAIVNAKVFR